MEAEKVAEEVTASGNLQIIYRKSSDWLLLMLLMRRQKHATFTALEHSLTTPLSDCD